MRPDRQREIPQQYIPDLHIVQGQHVKEIRPGLARAGSGIHAGNSVGISFSRRLLEFCE